METRNDGSKVSGAAILFNKTQLEVTCSMKNTSITNFFTHKLHIEIL